MQHVSSQSPARQKIIVARGAATATALSSRLHAESNAGSAELQLQLPAAIDNTVADSVVVDSVAAGDVVTGENAVAVAMPRKSLPLGIDYKDILFRHRSNHISRIATMPAGQPVIDLCESN